MEQKVERKPLLSDEEATSLRSDIDSVALRVRDWYEAAIDRGELVIPKTAKGIEYGHGEAWCSLCGKQLVTGDFCPGCGARIID